LFYVPVIYENKTGTKSQDRGWAFAIGSTGGWYCGHLLNAAAASAVLPRSKVLGPIPALIELVQPGEIGAWPREFA